MASQTSHPLPVPPGQGQYQQNPPQRQPQQYQYQQSQPPQPPQHQNQQQYQSGQQKARPRSRGFSFRSDKSHKSHKSSGSKDNHHHKVDLQETSAEKESHRLHSKADPSVAMNEAEPAAVQATAKTSLAPLRGIQHKDALGNPIADPDLSNPTRSRWERPLDTIRSFEAAIDGGYRKSYLRSDSESVMNMTTRRSSYYGTNGGPNGGGGRFPQDSYYGGRPQSGMRLEEQPAHYPRQSGGPPRDSYYNGEGGYNNGYSPGPNNAGRQRYPRTASEPHFNSYRQQADPNVYPIPNNHRSYETVGSASGSGTSGEPAGYQTDLTSDNSSAERVQAVQRRKQEPTNDYGIGFSQNPALPSASFSVGVNSSAVNTNSPLGNVYQTNGGAGYGPPPVPSKESGRGTLLRKPTNQTVETNGSASKPDKRKSWFSKRFSKSS